MSLELIYQLLAGVLMAGAVYGGIRMDIINIHRALKETRETVKEAHNRIDNLLMKGSK